MDRKKNELSRREILQAAAAASFGTALLSPAALAAQAQRVQEGQEPGAHEPIRDTPSTLETTRGSWFGEAGSAREATLAEFKPSEHIAGVSMRLKPGGI